MITLKIKNWSSDMRIKNSKEEVEELQEETRRRPDSEDDQEEAGYETKGKPDPALLSSRS